MKTLRLYAVALIAGLACIPLAAPADEDMPYQPKPKTQQDIAREREQACRGLTGEARNECLANYVGPSHEKSGGAWKRPPSPPRPQGRS